MILTGENIKFRALEPADAGLLYKWENNSDIWNVSNTIVPFSRYTLEQYVNSIQDIYITKQLRLMICLNNEDFKPVGCIDLFDFDPLHSRAGVGIIIADKADRQKGYASEAIALIINYCFSVLYMHQLYCNIAADNETSLNLFLNKGFKMAGTKKEWLKSAHGFTDEHLLQLINNQTF